MQITQGTTEGDGVKYTGHGGGGREGQADEENNHFIHNLSKINII